MMVQSQNYSTQKYFVVWKTKYLSCACLLNHIFSFTVHHLQPRNFIHCDHRKLHLFHAQGLCIVCREHISRDRLLSTSTFYVKNSALSALSCLVITDVHMHSSNALMSTPCLLRGVFFFPFYHFFTVRSQLMSPELVSALPRAYHHAVRSWGVMCDR